MVKSVLFVEIECCWWKLRRIELELWQMSQKLVRVDLEVGNG